MNEARYVPALDGLRAVAVGLVVVGHLSYRLAPGGNVGVDVFFVLSGYVITLTLLREHAATGAISIPRFFVRRALRLLPALLAVVMADVVVGALFGGPNGRDLNGAVAAISYITDYVRANGAALDTSPLGHTWSLAIEEQFYVVWPMLLLAVLRFAPARRVVAAGVILLAAIAWHGWLVLDQASHNHLYYGPDSRACQLLAGCVLALWRGQTAPRRAAAAIARLWPLAAAALGLIVMRGNAGQQGFGGASFLVAAAAAMVLILELTQRREGLASQWLSSRLAVQIGVISYGIYLWQYPLLFEAGYWSGDKHSAALAASGLSVAMAALSHKYVERPFLQRKVRFDPDTTPQAATSHKRMSGSRGSPTS